MELVDQTIRNKVEIKNLVSPREYSHDAIKELYIGQRLSVREIHELYRGEISHWKLKTDVRKWGFTTQFFEQHSLTKYYEEKYLLYKKMIEAYTGTSSKSVKAQYRELTEVMEEQKKQLQEIKAILADAGDEINKDVIMESIEARITNKIDALDMIKIQQKDQDTMLKLNTMQDNILSELLEIRKQEVNQINVENIIGAIYEEIQHVETKTGQSGLAASFRANLRRKILEVTGSKQSLMSEEVGVEFEKDIERTKEKVKNVLKVERMQRLTAYVKKYAKERNIGYNEAQQELKGVKISKQDMEQAYIEQQKEIKKKYE